MVLTLKNIPYEEKVLYQPPLQEIQQVLTRGLPHNFEHVKVDVVSCPDLRLAPFTLASAGLNGKCRIVEIGGPPYLLPLVQRDKLYDLKEVADLIRANPVYIIGAGAGPWPYASVNCEGMFNMKIDNGKVEQHTRIAKVNTENGKCIQERLPNSESRCALLGNLLLTEGKPGEAYIAQVVQVHCKKRIGPDDFIASIRKTLAEHYGPGQVVGLGGTFLLKEGKAKQHVMPDFSAQPITTDEGVNEWLRFYEMSSPLVAVGTLVTGEYDLDLRVQHFHSFSHHGEGGHYHIDTTPDTVEYLGYFTLGEKVYRIDKPQNTHKVGRD